jgi:putative endonuclease
MPGFVYMLASQKNGTIYIGSTVDLTDRMQTHRDKAVAGFTARYGVTRLVYAEEHPTIYDARIRERQMKKWNRVWKIRLIEETNPDWEDLAKFL